MNGEVVHSSTTTYSKVESTGKSPVPTRGSSVRCISAAPRDFDSVDNVLRQSQLSHLVPIFREKNIGWDEFMTLDQSELEDMDVVDDELEEVLNIIAYQWQNM